MSVIDITAKAVSHVKKLLEDQEVKDKVIGLKIGVETGGCSGLSY